MYSFFAATSNRLQSTRLVNRFVRESAERLINIYQQITSPNENRCPQSIPVCMIYYYFICLHYIGINEEKVIHLLMTTISFYARFECDEGTQGQSV